MSAEQSAEQSAVPTGSATQTVLVKVRCDHTTIEFTERDIGQCRDVKGLKSLIHDKEGTPVKDQTLTLPVQGTGKRVLEDNELIEDVCNGRGVTLQLQKPPSPKEAKEERKLVCETDERKYNENVCGPGGTQHNGDKMTNGNLGIQSRTDKREYCRNEVNDGNQHNGNVYS